MIIGLGYQARTGKDTVGAYLHARYGFNVTSFAYSLKEAAKVIYGWGDEHVYGDLKETVDPYWGVTPRHVLQQLGTEGCRKVLREDIWIRSLERRLAGDIGADWVITDVRYPNEADFITLLGGHNVRVLRPGVSALLSPTAQTHISERAMGQYGGWTYQLMNDKAIPDLYEQVDKMVESLRNYKA